jgi:hypothetical protein
VSEQKTSAELINFTKATLWREEGKVLCKIICVGDMETRASRVIVIRARLITDYIM